MNVTVADGFKFGCGLFLAAAFAVAALVLLGAAFLFATSLFGVRLPLPGA